jgi:hypothetical protein
MTEICNLNLISPRRDRVGQTGCQFMNIFAVRGSRSPGRQPGIRGFGLAEQLDKSKSAAKLERSAMLGSIISGGAPLIASKKGRKLPVSTGSQIGEGDSARAVFSKKGSTDNQRVCTVEDEREIWISALSHGHHQSSPLSC